MRRLEALDALVLVVLLRGRVDDLVEVLRHVLLQAVLGVGAHLDGEAVCCRVVLDRLWCKVGEEQLEHLGGEGDALVDELDEHVGDADLDVLGHVGACEFEEALEVVGHEFVCIGEIADEHDRLDVAEALEEVKVLCVLWAGGFGEAGGGHGELMQENWKMSRSSAGVKGALGAKRRSMSARQQATCALTALSLWSMSAGVTSSRQTSLSELTSTASWSISLSSVRTWRTRLSSASVEEPFW